MPWKPSQAHSKTHKADTPKAQRAWATIANSVLKRGGSEGSAIRQANAVVGRGFSKKGK